ncbi:MAG: bifunctional diaminohydroxyphosphoribosylaminopyrimidine deaminase/5-amino-6-(5-phosphoribosylamino)uracil reductase RibD [Deltaproteobacteria bacterium]|nr:bifunctional diaminohydroxyphosphoribosylaminopyrimidine deaminase/5-amino-6-(5-phosphoribosylamino)uracil reductase RibD [Deltaproteobacteria bacterium]
MTPSAFSWLLPDAPPPTTPLALALAEATKGVGRTRPNPPVGCVVLDDDGRVLGRGFHARAGDRHAEVVALDDVVSRHGDGAARGKTLVVTLEPCTHHGRTPPCVDRVLGEGVARVVVGALDPNPRVHGTGVARLQAAGVDVVVAAADEGDGAACVALLQPFASAQRRGRPWVVLKTATSLDGKVATRARASRFLTGPPSRVLVHALRDAVDAVVVGAATALTDDPALTVRDAPLRGVEPRDPLRVLLDRRLAVPSTATLFAPPGALVFCDSDVAPVSRAGAEHVTRGTALPTVLDELGRRDLLAVLVEAGPTLSAALLRDDLVDELWWFHAPLVLGGDGVPAVASLAVDALADARRFAVAHRVVCGDDALTILRRPRAPTHTGS